MLKKFLKTDAIRLNYSKEPELSVSLTGCTVLKSTILKSRFSGSRSYIVDRSGCLQKKEVVPKKSYKKKTLPQKKFYSINKSRVKHILQNFINCQKNKKSLYFYTISFPIGTSDSTAHKILNSWLTSLRHAYNLKNYLWVSERQKNGTIHFHLAIKEYLPIRLVNGLIKKLLHYYIRKGELNWNHFACARYNGVDIAKNRVTKKVINFASQKDGKALGNYLTKYISKTNEKFPRQAWQSSHSLSGLFSKYNMCYAEFEDAFIQKLDIEFPLFENDFYSFFKWRREPPPEIVFLLSLVNRQVLGRAATS